MAIHSLPWSVPANINAFYTSRTDGFGSPPYDSFNLAHHVSDSEDTVLKNREKLQSLVPKARHWQWLEQVHGTEVLLIDDANALSQQELTADGLVCRVPGVVCCILTADCLPDFFADRWGREVAIAHAGWRGLAGGILEATISKMDAEVEDVVAYLGPAIGPCHFEVGAEVLKEFLSEPAEPENQLEVMACFSKVRGSEPPEQKYLADLYALASQRLKRLGVTQISGGDSCTVCQQETFFSYRRDGETGRMLSAISFE